MHGSLSGSFKPAIDVAIIAVNFRFAIILVISCHVYGDTAEIYRHRKLIAHQRDRDDLKINCPPGRATLSICGRLFFFFFLSQTNRRRCSELLLLVKCSFMRHRISNLTTYSAFWTQNENCSCVEMTILLSMFQANYCLPSAHTRVDKIIRSTN